MHITLKFLGEIDPQQILELNDLAKCVVQPYAPCELALAGLGVFPNPTRPRAVWVGARRVPETLLNLQIDLERALAGLGFREDRRFAPHVTLGRVRESDSRSLQQLCWRVEDTEVTPNQVNIKAITLMESVLSPKGPTYLPAFQVPL